ncbi:hypothetical protein [Kribbella sindirgiensis]|uniref:Uncharacterized protein n=1 Tax=Kribbella sindirgiensis TaxID=1124744 RepID=A0A4R0J522_9ACTN|nr:hypothetical protein [Kribbella sindirgiensis]TCC39386.1 hypothetical protein E0H50_05475 [Kribbella sindirgiensis]
MRQSDTDDLAQQIKEYLDKKIESEFGLLHLKLSHIDIMLNKIYDELGGTDPNYTTDGEELNRS